MKTGIAAVTAGIVGVVIGAGGWALFSPDGSSDAPPAAHTEPRINPVASKPTGPHYASAQAIADKMSAAGLIVSMLHKDTSGNYVEEAGGSTDNLQISEKPGQNAGDSSIDMFPTHEALASWVEISKGFSGIAVVGDTWAVSLPSTGAFRPDTEDMVPKIAKALGGTVEK